MTPIIRLGRLPGRYERSSLCAKDPERPRPAKQTMHDAMPQNLLTVAYPNNSLMNYRKLIPKRP